MKPSVEKAFEQLDAIRERAELFGITVDHRIFESGRQGRQSLHVMFDGDGRRLVDYWPGSGAVLLGGPKGDKACSASLGDAMELAQRELRRRVQHMR